mgnify:FL=1
MKIKIRDLILVSLFAALTAIGAFIRIDIPYVPFTMQFFFCALSGILLGSRLGALSQLLYVTIGLIGIPIFTKGGGPGYIFQPTFGYLVGFIFAAYTIGKLKEMSKDFTFTKAFLAIACGLIIVYLFGAIHLYLIYNLYLQQPKTVSWVLMYGCLIFIGGDLLSGAIAALIAVRMVPVIGFER